MKTPELKSCPFCGGEADVWNDGITKVGLTDLVTIWRAHCTTCKTSVMSHKSVYHFNEYGEFVMVEDGKRKTIDTWNRRASDDNPAKS